MRGEEAAEKAEEEIREPGVYYTQKRERSQKQAGSNVKKRYQTPVTGYKEVYSSEGSVNKFVSLVKNGSFLVRIKI